MNLPVPLAKPRRERGARSAPTYYQRRKSGQRNDIRPLPRPSRRYTGRSCSTWIARYFARKNSRDRFHMCLVQKVRTPKGPRNVKQIYLETANALFEKLQGRPSTPLRSFPFGLGACLSLIFVGAAQEGVVQQTPRSLFDGYRVETSSYSSSRVVWRRPRPARRWPPGSLCEPLSPLPLPPLAEPYVVVSSASTGERRGPSVEHKTGAQAQSPPSTCRLD